MRGDKKVILFTIGLTLLSSLYSLQSWSKPEPLKSLLASQKPKKWPNLVADYSAYWQEKKILDRKKAPSTSEIESAQSAALLVKLNSTSKNLERELDESYWALEIRRAEAAVAKKNYTLALNSFQRVVQTLNPARWPYYWRETSSQALSKLCLRNKKSPDEDCLYLAKKILDQFPKAASETVALRDLPFPENLDPPEVGGDRLSQSYPEKQDKDEKAFEDILKAYFDENESSLSRTIDDFNKDYPKSMLRFRAQFLMAELQFKKGHSKEAEKIYQGLMDAVPLGFYALVSAERLKLSQKDKIKTQPLMVDVEQLSFNPQEEITLKRIDTLSRMKKRDEIGFELDSLTRSRNYNLDTVLYLMGLADRYQHHLAAFRLVNELIQRQYDGLLNSELIEIIFPFVYENEIAEATKNNKVDPLLVMSLTKQESGFKLNSVSGSGALGLMQLMPFTALEVDPNLKLSMLREPQSNIMTGTGYLSTLLTKYDGNVAFALAAYNGGPHRLSRWQKDLKPGASMIDFIESIPYRETRDYVSSILRNRYWYQVRKGITPTSLFDSWKF